MQKKFTKKRKNLTAVHIVENEQRNNTLCGFISKKRGRGCAFVHPKWNIIFVSNARRCCSFGHNANYV